MLNLENSTCFVLEEISINITKTKISTNAVDYTNILKSFFFQLIEKPMRVTNLSQSIIDHLVTNDQKPLIAPRVIECGSLSDRYPVFILEEKIKIYNATPTKQFAFRNLRNFKADQYCNDLEFSLN